MSVSDRLSRYLPSVKRGVRAKPRSRQVLPRIELLEGRAVPAAIATPPLSQDPLLAPNDFSDIHPNSDQTDVAPVLGTASEARHPRRPVQQTLVQGSVRSGGLGAAVPL